MTGLQHEVVTNPAVPPGLGRPKARDLADILTIALITAQATRFVAAIVSGVVHGTFVLPDESHAQSLGVAVQAAADYADGQGVLILVAALGLTWWQLERWSEWLRYHRALTSDYADSGPLRTAEMHLRRTRRFAVAIAASFLVAAVGAIAYTVGTVLVESGTGLSQVAASAVLGNGGFNLAYVVIAVPAAIIALRLRSRPASSDPPAAAATRTDGGAGVPDPSIWKQPDSEGGATTQNHTSGQA